MVSLGVTLSLVIRRPAVNPELSSSIGELNIAEIRFQPILKIEVLHLPNTLLCSPLWLWLWLGGVLGQLSPPLRAPISDVAWAETLPTSG